MSKYLVLDTDRSLASIGGDEGCEEALGFRPVPVSDGVGEAKGVLRQLLTKQERPGQHPFLPNQKETRFVPNPKAAEMGLTGLVIDTASTLADQEFERHLRALNARRQAEERPLVASLDQSTWGPYADAMMGLWTLLSKAEITVVATCHEQRKENDVGVSEAVPFIRGSSATKMLRLFDAVLYTKTRRTQDGTEYLWQTKADHAHFAKLRGIEAEPMIPQDFGPLLTAFRASGTPHPKILVIGESGTGKSTALTTLT